MHLPHNSAFFYIRSKKKCSGRVKMRPFTAVPLQLIAQDNNNKNACYTAAVHTHKSVIIHWIFLWS